MGYPMKECESPFGGTTFREMTVTEYLMQLEFYRNYIKNHKNDSSRRVQDYISYLERWFGDGLCDGVESYEQRFRLHKLPMTANSYMFE